MNLPFFKQTLVDLLNVDSPAGLNLEMEDHIVSFVQQYGLRANRMRKGGVWADMGGIGDTLYVMVHCDTVGLVVNGINADGTLKVTYIGGLRAHSSERANVRVHTREGNVFSGTIQRIHSCAPAAPAGFNEQPADYDTNLCLVLDELVDSDKGVEMLGIRKGDVIALAPDYVFTDNGFIKSRYLDDKVCVALMMSLIDDLMRGGVQLGRHLVVGFTMYEEVGHGGSWIPPGVQDVLSIDVAAVSPLTSSKEDAVTIYTQDSRSPYHYGMLQELMAVAERSGIDYNLDVMYPKGSTDSSSSIIAGHDVRHAAIGPGVRGIHGYERAYMTGLQNTYQLIREYVVKE